MLDTFDYSNTTSPLSERPVTTVAPQALQLLNDEFMQQQAAALANRIRQDAGDNLTPFVSRGFQLAVGRAPSKREHQLAREFIGRQEKNFAGITTRLTFRVDVPASLAVSYMNVLKPEHFLNGPASGWTYHRGRWSAAYEGIRTMERDRGPFALCTAQEGTNVMVDATVLLHNACESAGLLLRASAKADELSGYEVALEPREQRLVLRRHAQELQVLAQARADIPTATSLPLRIQLTGSKIRVWAADLVKPVLEFVDPAPILSPGHLGVKVSGAALSIDDLTIHPEGGASVALRDAGLELPPRRALQAFCLLLLNLNEVVYVD